MVGSSVAYFLSANPDFTGRIAVVERDPQHPNRLRLTLDGLYSFEVTRSEDGSSVTLDLLTHDDRFSAKSLTVDEGDLVEDPDDG